MIRFILNWFRKKSPDTDAKMAKTVCSRVGESLSPPAGSVIRSCNSCGQQITVDPKTVERQRELRHMVLICLQCIARDEPDLVLFSTVIIENGQARVKDITVAEQLHSQLVLGLSKP
jgi:hypothetical protein